MVGAELGLAAVESLQEEGLGISVEGLGHVQDIPDCARDISDVYGEIPSAERQKGKRSCKGESRSFWRWNRIKPREPAGGRRLGGRRGSLIGA